MVGTVFTVASLQINPIQFAQAGQTTSQIEGQSFRKLELVIHSFIHSFTHFLCFCFRAPEKFDVLFEGLQSTKSDIQDLKTEIVVGAVSILLFSEFLMGKKDTATRERMDATQKRMEERMDAMQKRTEERMDATQKQTTAMFLTTSAIAVLAIILPLLPKS